MIWNLLFGKASKPSLRVETVAAPPANPDWFWSIIEQILSAPNMDAQIKALEEALEPLSEAELIAFDADYRRALSEAYRWDLWAAAYVLEGGCSDDGFDYFCDWLISRGREVFAAAIADPASIIHPARAMSEDDYIISAESFRYVVQDVYERKTNNTMPMVDVTLDADPAGEEFDEDTVHEVYPELAEFANDRG